MQRPLAKSKRTKSTSTSSFGVGKRESHDSSKFYARFVAPQISQDEEIYPHKEINKIFLGDSRNMSKIPDNSVALVVTSPPYFVGKEYELAVGKGLVPGTYHQYLQMLYEVFKECVRVLEPGGKIAVNVANLGRKPYRSLSCDVTDILQNKLKMLLRGEIIWQKAKGASGSCAWGSFMKASNPVLRDVTERIIVASKSRFDRALSEKERKLQGLPYKSTIKKEEFLEATLDIWQIAPESAAKIGHPAPFPVEIPERLINLYTYESDLVLDPFMGSGTTAIACIKTKRNYAGYDTSRKYVSLSRKRIANYVDLQTKLR
jgi:DNA modification methylase